MKTTTGDSLWADQQELSIFHIHIRKSLAEADDDYNLFRFKQVGVALLMIS